MEAERSLAPWEDAFVAALRQKVGKGEVDHQWVARVEGAPVRMAEGWTLDIQDGTAHGGSLRFLRIVLATETADIERIDGDGASVVRHGPLVTTVRRATVPRAEIDALLGPCGALAAVHVERRRIEGASSDGSWGFSLDSYLLVRLRDAAGRVVVDRHFVGYVGEDALVKLWPLELGTDDLLAYVGRIPSWTEVPEAEKRDCHLTAAFEANREVMTGDFAWFVEERSLEMLAQAGNRGAIPTLEWLAGHEADGRRTRKIRTLLADPDRWLAGPPRDLEEAD